MGWGVSSATTETNFRSSIWGRGDQGVSALLPFPFPPRYPPFALGKRVFFRKVAHLSVVTVRKVAHFFVATGQKVAHFFVESGCKSFVGSGYCVVGGVAGLFMGCVLSFADDRVPLSVLIQVVGAFPRT